MKIQIPRSDLLSGLQRVQGVIERRNTMPVLANLLLEARANRITIFATDLEIGLKTSHPAQIETEGAVAVSARKLFEIVRELPEVPVKLSCQENFMVRVEAGKSEFKIMGLPPQEFPSMPAIEAEAFFPIERKVLASLIKKTVFAVGDNDARYILNGLMVLVHPKDRGRAIKLVGTDGHRLSVIDRLISSPGPPTAGGESTAIVPKKAILEVRKLLEESEKDVEIAVGRNQFVFRSGDTVLIARLMEGNYPNYQQVIPKENDREVRVGRVEFEGALRRVSILAREKTNAIKLELKPGNLILSANHPEMGEAQEEIPTPCEGEPISMGFNAKYLLDVLAAIEAEVVLLYFKDALSPCLIREDGDKDYLCVVMPMRV